MEQIALIVEFYKGPYHPVTCHFEEQTAMIISLCIKMDLKLQIFPCLFQLSIALITVKD
jgi:hypothetical protein